MEVTYETDALRELCEVRPRAARELGNSIARKLFARVADLRAASTVVRLPAGKPHRLKGSRSNQYAIDLTDGKRLVLAPHGTSVPKLPSGGIKWDAVTKVRIIEIGSYDD